MNLFSLKNKRALVTGAAGHIGRAISNALASYGADLVLVDINQETLESLADELRDTCQVEILPKSVNLEDPDSVNQLSQSLLDELDNLEVLVHCAALVGTSDLKGWVCEFKDQSEETWMKAIQVNLTSIFQISRDLTPLLSKSDKSSIITVSSIYGVVGPDMRIYGDSAMGNPAAYAASKAGLIQYTKWLSTVLAPNVRANSISLGGIFRGQSEDFLQRYCDKTPLGRMGTEEDVVGAVVYLASDASSYVTGQNLMIDGGWTAW
jgi:NAD(P)-dependent dehydrogenase (short-subunit alcohol dehydrogenase family)